jgi:hypothetical protein
MKGDRYEENNNLFGIVADGWGVFAGLAAFCGIAGMVH